MFKFVQFSYLFIRNQFTYSFTFSSHIYYRLIAAYICADAHVQGVFDNRMEDIACLGKLFSSLNFRHSISIIHHSSLITHNSSLIFSHSFGNITFIFITQFFHTIHGSHTCQPVQFFFFFLVPNSPKLIYIKK